MNNDPIADFLTRIRNAAAARHGEFETKASKLIIRLGKILGDEGYIGGVELVGEKPQPRIKVTMKYDENGKPPFDLIERVSRSSRRVYLSSGEIKPVRGGTGMMILSTSRGLLTDRAARRERAGGEVLMRIW